MITIHNKNKNIHAILIVIGILFISGIMEKLNYTLFQFTDELILLFLALCIRDRRGLFFLITLSFFSLAGSYFNFANILQTILDLKLLACLLFYSRYKNTLCYSDVRSTIDIFLYINIAFYIIEIFLSELYQTLFVGDFQAQLTVLGYSFYRFQGAFMHPGELALFCIIAITFYSQTLLKVDRYKAFILTLMLISTGQRAEILAFLAALMTIYTFNFQHYFFKKAYGSIPVFFGIIYITISLLLKTDIYMDDNARTILYKASLIAIKESPVFGYGAGTYASHYSFENIHLYRFLDLESFWWFQDKRYITDVFWPKLIVEYGLIGFLIWIGLIREIQKHVSHVLFISFMIISLQAPIFFNIKLLLLGLIVSHAKNTLSGQSINKNCRRNKYIY